MIVHKHTAAVHDEHQVGKCAQDGAVLRLGLPQVALGAPASGPLDQKAADQEKLRREDQCAADHIASIAREERRLSKANHAAGRKSRLADLPACELACVELIRIAVNRRDRNRLRLLSAQHTRRDTRRLPGILQRRVQPSADDAGAHGAVMPAVDGNIRRLRDGLDGIERHERTTRTIVGETQKVDDRMWWQMPHPLFEIGK